MHIEQGHVSTRLVEHHSLLIMLICFPSLDMKPTMERRVLWDIELITIPKVAYVADGEQQFHLCSLHRVEQF
jgi:hypothetical protein